MDGWKKVADSLNYGSEKLKPVGLRAGYHNHLAEFQPLDGKRPMEVLAANTVKDVVLQFDVGIRAWKLVPIRWHGSKPIPDALRQCMRRTGHLSQAKAIRYCSEMAWPNGRRSSKRPRRLAGSNII